MRRAVLIGDSGRPLVDLLSDVLAEIDMSVDVDTTGGPHAMQDATPGAPPDLVLVMVDRNDLAGLFQRARAIAGSAPVVAILPFEDELLAKRSLGFGASGFYSLDMPIAQLKSRFFPRSDMP